MLSPRIFPSHGAESVRFARLVSDSVTGAVILGASATALQELQPRSEWINFFAGLWLLAAPGAIGFAGEPGPLRSTTVAGALAWTAAAFALPAARAYRRRGHPGT